MEPHETTPLSDEEKFKIQTQFRAAVDGSDVEEVAHALFLHGDILGEAPKHKSVEEILNENDQNLNSESSQLSSYYQRALEAMKMWKASLAEGAAIDMFRVQEYKWYGAKIIRKDGDLFSVHYDGWSAKYDDHGLVFADCMMYPRGTAVKKKKAAKRKEKMVTYEILEVKEEVVPAVIEDKTARRAKAARNLLPDPEKKTTVKRQKTKEEEDLEDSMRREWVCSVCYQLEAPDDSVLILCDGLCKRSFHLGCLNLSEVSTSFSKGDCFLFSILFYVVTLFRRKTRECWQMIVNGGVMNVKLGDTHALFAEMKERTMKMSSCAPKPTVEGFITITVSPPSLAITL